MPAGHRVRQLPQLNGEPVQVLAGFLADPAVAAAVLAETSFEHDHAAIGLGLFAESVEPLAPGAARPALRWLRAKAYERLGDLELVESYGFVPVYD